MTQTETIPAGYKKTEIGIIPEDWSLFNIDEIADVLSGKRIPKGKSLTKNATAYPYITVSDMKSGSINLENIKFIPEDVYPFIKNYRIFIDDIYISVAGTLGLVGTIPKQLNGANLTENANRLTNIKCDKRFLLYLLLSPLIQNKIDEVKTLGAQPKLALTRIRKFNVMLPQSKSEQKVIAEVLSDTDALIECLEKLIAKKKAIKQGAMQQLLTGKKRLPGFTGEWENMKLGRLVDYKNGKSFESHIVDNGDYYLITLNSLDINGKLRKEHLRVAFNDKSLNKNDLIMILSDVAHGYFLGLTDVIPEDNKYVLNQRVGALKNIRYVAPYYLSKYINIRQKYFKSIGQGSSQQNLNRDDILNFKVCFPTEKSEQLAITYMILDMDAEIEKLEQKRDKYISIKQGMMQQLLTGKIRLIKNGDN